MVMKQRLFVAGCGTMGVVVLVMVAAIATLALYGCGATVGSDLRQDAANVRLRNGAPNTLTHADGEATRSIATVGPVSETEMEIPWDLEAVVGSDGKAVEVGATYATIKNRNGGVASREVITKFLGSPFLLRSGDGFKVTASKVSYDPVTKLQVAENVSIESRVDESTRAMNDLNAAFGAYARERDATSGEVLKRSMEMWEKVAPESVNLVRAALAAFGLPDPTAVLK